MDLHHPILREFPEHREIIRRLKGTDDHFRKMFDEYHRLDDAVYRIEEEIDFATDQETEELKMQRARLKDHIYHLVRYAPRAIIIGLFAPFPNMWLAVGEHVGRLGKLLADFETLLIYFMESLCVVGVWQRRRLFASWLLLFTAVLGCGAVAMVMVNVGSIYRLRYSFWMLIVVLGSGALVRLLSKVSKTQKAQINAAAVM